VGYNLLRNLHTDPRWPVFLKKNGLSDWAMRRKCEFGRHTT
jgi:hypothetical protein